MYGHRLTRFFSLIGTALVLVFAASWAQAGMLSFDDISLEDGSFSSQQYGGFQWDNRWELGSTSLTGLSKADSPGGQFLYNSALLHSELEVSRDDPFDFLGASFATSSQSSLTTFRVKFWAFDATGKIFDSGFFSVSQKPVRFDVTVEGAIRVVFDSRGGLFTLDDFTFREPEKMAQVNEAGGFVLLIIGLAGLWAARRRIRG